MKKIIKSGQWRIGHIIAVVWIVFSVLYVVNDARVYLVKTVYGIAYSSGQQNAVMRVMQHGSSCEPFALKLGQEGTENFTAMQFVNVACLQQTAQAEAESETEE